ncbi:hypothetical protein [Planctomycetes bacterium K23_9]|uniref:Uncharacterized protein n=1 Tax=Stieleria marina TaxID=1930275 RepID=A0A517NSX0_9BACT|nr:hypothetical protein K239x_21610 [Planctomycetes bacterium K23_9]
MNIQPNHAAASVAGTPVAASRASAEASGTESTRHAADAIRLDDAAATADINEGGRADQRGGDGRQMRKRSGSNRDADTKDELDLSVSKETNSDPATDAPQPSRLDYEA